jgi:hypothetical protein
MAVMSLRLHALEPVPEETARVAHAAFPKGNPYLILRDTLGTIFQDLTFRTLFRSSEAILTEPPEERGGRAMTRAFQSTSLFDFPFSSS